MKKNKIIRIGELSQQLSVERTIIDMWEKEFNIQASRTKTRQRYYTLQDVQKFQIIQELIYIQKHNLAQAKKYFKEHKYNNISQDQLFNAAKITESKKQKDTQMLPEGEFTQKMIALQKKLLKLRELL